MRLAALVLLAACADATPASKGGDTAACDPAADADADGLDDCAEADLGTDPAAADTDGDGLADGAERDCVSDPLDAAEVCYACGWPHGDPGSLQATGTAEGDVIQNLGLVDQCGETLELWDLAGGWTLLYMTTEWCGACLNDVKDLPADRAAFLAETGIDLATAVVLFEDSAGQSPGPETAARYAERAGIADQPVLADGEAAVISATPYRGEALPGLCALTPEMQILTCTTGDSDHGAMLDRIAEAASAR